MSATIKHIFCSMISTLMASFIFLACSEVTVDGLDPSEFPLPFEVPTDVSFSQVVKPILVGNCLQCHGPTPLGDNNTLSFTSVDAYDRIVEKISNTDEPDLSIFMLYASGKVSGHTTGTLAASSKNYAIIRQWIVEGALNN